MIIARLIDAFKFVIENGTMKYYFFPFPLLPKHDHRGVRTLVRTCVRRSDNSCPSHATARFKILGGVPGTFSRPPGGVGISTTVVTWFLVRHCALLAIRNKMEKFIPVVLREIISYINKIRNNLIILVI